MDDPAGLNDDERNEVGRVFEAHAGYITGVATQYARSQNDVPDIVQQVGLKLCKALPGFRGESRLTTWLYRVTANMAMDYNRQGARRAIRETELDENVVEPAVSWDPAEAIGGNDAEQQYEQRRRALFQVIPRLRKTERAVVTQQLEGESVLKSRRTTLHRAHGRLRRLLNGEPD